MKELSPILSSATKAIEHGYFHLNIDGGDPVYRERVYCYELYHQMRSLWPPNCEYYLNGEIDKAAHPILRQLGADQVKPDLLVHCPGYMSGNHAIIEVKTLQATYAGIEKDLKTLSLFINRVNYKRAIYLFYGYGDDVAMINRIQKIAVSVEKLAPIEIWIHKEVGQPATHITTIK